MKDDIERACVLARKRMGTLYNETKKSNIDLKTASELANITGKYLKAIALQQAREEWLARK